MGLKGEMELEELIRYILDSKRKQAWNRVVFFGCIFLISIFSLIPPLWGYLAVFIALVSFVFYKAEHRLYQTIVLEVDNTPNSEGISVKLLNEARIKLNYNYSLKAHKNGDLALLNMEGKQFAWIFRDGTKDNHLFLLLKEFAHSSSKITKLPKTDFGRRRKIYKI